MTILEIMVVLAVIAGAFFIVRSAFRQVTKADLVEDSIELTAIVKRASQLAVEHGELHRVLLDIDTGAYSVEQCEARPRSSATRCWATRKRTPRPRTS